MTKQLITGQMTDQERLKEIKGSEVSYYLEGTRWKQQWGWLIEQAEEKMQLEERVQDLEGKLWNANEDARVFQLRALTSEKKNQRNKQALEKLREYINSKSFYENSWDVHVVNKMVNEALEGGTND